MKGIIHHLAGVFLLLATLTTQAQNPWIDSLKHLSSSQHEDTAKVRTLLMLAGAYEFSQPDSSLSYGYQALALSTKLSYDWGEFWSIVMISGGLNVTGNYALELEYAFRVLPLGQKLNTPYTIGFSNGMLSDAYYNLGDYETSLSYWRVSMKIARENSLKDLYSVHGNTARIFAALRQYDSALVYIYKCYALVKASPTLGVDNYDGRRIRSNLFVYLGDTFEGLGIYDSAEYYYRRSVPYSIATAMDINAADAAIGMASVFRSTGHPDSVILYAKKALKERITKRYPVAFLKATTLLANIYESQNIPDSALKYLHLSLQAKDSLFNRQKTIAVQNILFNEQEKQREIQAATAELQNRYRIYAVIALLIIASIAAGVFIRNQRIKHVQKIRNSIADDLHDDIGSTLSSISIMSELAKAKSGEAMPLLTSIGESTSTIQENMSDIVWAIKAGNDRFENVLQRMNQFASGILDSKNIALDFVSDESLAASKLTMEQRKNFYLFFKEVINNAAKHSGAEKVCVRVAKEDRDIQMFISDNGRGFDTTKIFNGNGMTSLKKRVAELNAQFNLTSLVNEGTTVQLRFRVV